MSFLHVFVLTLGSIMVNLRLKKISNLIISGYKDIIKN